MQGNGHQKHFRHPAGQKFDPNWVKGFSEFGLVRYYAVVSISNRISLSSK